MLIAESALVDSTPTKIRNKLQNSAVMMPERMA
jgi:hypothetical protein